MSSLLPEAAGLTLWERLKAERGDPGLPLGVVVDVQSWKRCGFEGDRESDLRSFSIELKPSIE